MCKYFQLTGYTEQLTNERKESHEIIIIIIIIMKRAEWLLCVKSKLNHRKEDEKRSKMDSNSIILL